MFFLLIVCYLLLVIHHFISFIECDSRANIQRSSCIYASCDLKFYYVSSPDLDAPTVDYMGFQMGSLLYFSDLGQYLKFAVKGINLDPFRSNHVNLGERVSTALC